jgi:hypothetical protein
MVTEQNILDADMSRKTTRKKKKRKENYCPYSRAVGGGEKEKKKLLSVQQRRRRMGRDMGVGPNRIEHWVWIVRARRWLKAWNGCHARRTRVVMRISSKLVMHDTIWWDHEAWS